MSAILSILSSNKDTISKASITILAALSANLEVIGDFARHISAITAVIVGILTIIKLVKDLFFNNKKKNHE